MKQNLFWKIGFFFLIGLAAFALLSKSYLKSQEPPSLSTAKKAFSQTLAPALVSISQDFGKAEKTGPEAPKMEENFFRLTVLKAGKKISVLYGVNQNFQIYRREGEKIEILASEVARIWISPANQPLSWNLLITGLVKIGDHKEAAIFNYTLAPINKER